MIRNPYFAGDVVVDQKKFVGRDGIIRDINADLPFRQVIVLYGQRRVGKSSILLRLYNDKLDGSQLLVPAYIDRLGQLNTPLDDLLRTLARRIKGCFEQKLPTDLGSRPSEEFKKNGFQWFTKS